ncbi:MAG: hypothetical protein ABSC18_05595 [Verrucomicrobiota bacterium]
MGERSHKGNPLLAHVVRTQIMGDFFGSAVVSTAAAGVPPTASSVRN